MSALASGPEEVRGGLRELFPLVYDEVRARARRLLARERAGHSLQASALAHEAYVRLAAQEGAGPFSRAQLLALAARMMRRILVDCARRRAAARRDARLLGMSAAEDAAAPPPPVDLLDLDAALDGLARLDPRQALVVELRFFGGFTLEETAEAAGVSTATVKREWETAKLYLARAVRC